MYFAGKLVYLIVRPSNQLAVMLPLGIVWFYIGGSLHTP